MSPRFVILGLLAAPLFSACSLVGFDDLETEPCIVGTDRDLASFAAGNALCAQLEDIDPSPEGLAWVCREQVGDDLYCVLSSPDADNDGVGAQVGDDPGLDCDDTDPDIFGGREEVSCDGKDNDCDESVDESLFTTFEPTIVDRTGVDRGEYGTSSGLFAFGGRSGSQLDVRVEASQPGMFAQRNDLDYGIAPVDSGRAMVVFHPPGRTNYRLQATDGPAIDPEMEDPTRDGMETANGPGLGTGGEDFVAAWYDAPIGNCGDGPAAMIRLVGGRLSCGLAPDCEPGAQASDPIDGAMAVPLQPPSVLPLSSTGEFLVLTSRGSSVGVTRVQTDRGVASIAADSTFEFGDQLAGFAGAIGDEVEGVVHLAIVAAVGCGTRELQMMPFDYDLATDTLSSSADELTRVDGEVAGVSSRPSIVWTALPRGFGVGWLAGRQPRLRLVGENGGVSGASIALDGGDLADATFPFGILLGVRDGGGVRAWAYGSGGVGGDALFSVGVGCGLSE